MPGSCVLPDGLFGFEVLAKLGYFSNVALAPKGKAGSEIAPFKWINVVLGNLKIALQ